MVVGIQLYFSSFPPVKFFAYLLGFNSVIRTHLYLIRSVIIIGF
jgi:hypothetical protein